MKTVKVNHVVLTLKINPAGNGMSQGEVDELVKNRLAEGYDEVETHIVRTNFGQEQAATDIVILYIFRAYEQAVGGSEAVTVAPKSKKSKAEGD